MLYYKYNKGKGEYIMKYSIAYTQYGFAIVEAENKTDAAKCFHQMNLAQISEISDGNLLFIESIEEERDE